jgi:hypothetical protein
MIDKKTSIRDLELAVVQAAMADHRGCAPETCGGSRLDPCPLANAINALMYACKECDAGGHTCPGDGNPIPNGAGDQVELRPTTAPDQPAHLTMDPAKPVEIHLTQIEADAIELMGWSSRVGLITGEATG